MPLPDSNHSLEDEHVIRIRREPLYVWLARLVWLIGLIVLLEYALASRQEREPQAAITAGALFLVILLAGVITEIVRHIESQPESRMMREMAREQSLNDRIDTSRDTLHHPPSIADNTGD